MYFTKDSLCECCLTPVLALALPDEDGMINPFAKKYRKSEEYSRLKTDLEEILEKAKNIPVTPPRTYAINYFWQVRMYTCVIALNVFNVCTCAYVCTYV